MERCSRNTLIIIIIISGKVFNMFQSKACPAVEIVLLTARTFVPSGFVQDINSYILFMLMFAMCMFVPHLERWQLCVAEKIKQ